MVTYRLRFETAPCLVNNSLFPFLSSGWAGELCQVRRIVSLYWTSSHFAGRVSTG